MYCQQDSAHCGNPFASPEIVENREHMSHNGRESKNNLGSHKTIGFRRKRQEEDQRSGANAFKYVECQYQQPQFPAKNPLGIVGPRVPASVFPYIYAIKMPSQYYRTGNGPKQVSKNNEEYVQGYPYR